MPSITTSADGWTTPFDRADLRVWLRVFTELEGARTDWMTPDPPTYAVRLDAISAHEGDEYPRTFRLRVTPDKSAGFLDAAEWKRVLEIAEREGLNVELANGGIELTGARSGVVSDTSPQ